MGRSLSPAVIFCPQITPQWIGMWPPYPMVFSSTKGSKNPSRGPRIDLTSFQTLNSQITPCQITMRYSPIQRSISPSGRCRQSSEQIRPWFPFIVRLRFDDPSTVSPLALLSKHSRAQCKGVSVILVDAGVPWNYGHVFARAPHARVRATELATHTCPWRLPPNRVPPVSPRLLLLILLRSGASLLVLPSAILEATPKVRSWERERERGESLGKSLNCCAVLGIPVISCVICRIKYVPLLSCAIFIPLFCYWVRSLQFLAWFTNQSCSFSFLCDLNSLL